MRRIECRVPRPSRSVNDSDSTAIGVWALLVAGLCLSAASVLFGAGESFTNEDVVELIEAGFGEDAVLAAIRANEPDFDTSTEAMLALKAAGVSDRIIEAMLVAMRPETAVEASGSGSESLPSGVGIYALEEGGYSALEVEAVAWHPRPVTSRRGSVTTKRYAARTRTRESPVRLSSAPDLVVICPEGVSATDYYLLRAEEVKEKKNKEIHWREFRIPVVLEGCSEHSWSRDRGCQPAGVARIPKSAVRFEAERLSGRRYRLRLPPLGKGEYAFLLPDESSALTSALYTFGVR